MSSRPSRKESPQTRARRALEMIAWEITWDEIRGDSEGPDDVRDGLEALAWAFGELGPDVAEDR